MKDARFLRALLSAVRRSLRNRFYIIYGMRGTAPINPAFGAGVGTPVDRHYIVRFLNENAELVKGTVLEVGGRSYTERHGTGVTRCDVLSAVPSTEATFVGDLSSCPEIADSTYDCIILTQVLNCIYDVRGAIGEVHRILRPGGSVLCTFPGISQVSRYDMERWGDRWRFTSQSASELFGKAFGPRQVRISTYGNAFSSICFLQGIPAERLRQVKLDRWEPDYQLIIGVRATKHADG